MLGRIRIRKRTWVVCRTEPRRELWASENVKRQGYTYYLPYYNRVDKGVTEKALLFPGYLFVQIKKDKQWSPLTNTYGMLDIVKHGREPAWLEDKVVQALQSQERGGVVVLPEQLDMSRFTKGQKVKLRSGPFLGYIGIYEGSTRTDRERVLLNLLGRETLIEVDTRQIEDVDLSSVTEKR